ncbi:carnosine N-methyltransferase isoform X3 [Glycine max]|uniref:carnosine N-methyltransferase isoform X3 n=2 Tax=Glycine max TaxID=3847 RepID=UPI0007190B76|nr:carnosine N-methyltransferase isoform X3 [Glycine max]|eukprot:XP_014621847.1 carnosine N-methyltransferase isoform X3 [Glycine max]
MEEAEEDQRRRLKLEEALEIQSLRRIISAYLNYPDAAEEDVRRNERSYRKLPPSHKALLSQYPQKFQRLRWCISMNTHFIFSMLQDADFSEDPHPESAQKDHLVSEGISACSCESAPVRITCSVSDQHCCVEGSNHTCRSQAQMHSNEEVGIESRHQSNTGNHSPRLIHTKETREYCGSPIADSKGNVPDTSSQQQWLAPSLKLNVPLVDADKVRCIIRNIVRDWAAEGKKERDQCYNPILEELNMLFPNRSKESMEFLKQSTCMFSSWCWTWSACPGDFMFSQGNEFSYYMMICSSFILNHSQTAGEWTIYPWIHSNCNSLSDSDQLRPVSIPDIHPASAGITEGFSMCGGDFVEVYSDSSQIGAWDAVVTCFFIDTAHNIVEYIEIISKILKDGGVWINLGPLLYHFADMYGQDDEMSIELSLEDVKRVAFHYGFEFENERTIETTYTANSRSMMQNRYFAAFWTMRKKSAAVQQQVP